ncbi:MAG: hypothetical protein ABEK29_11095, partial [Bradymonadaceae bacterium]
GARPVLLETSKPSVRTLAAAALAHLAAGDPSTADFATEQAIRRGERGRNDRLLLGGMQIAAAAGRAEAGYRRGQRASTADWNRDNNPMYLLGRAAADAAIGKSRRFYATRKSATKAAQRLEAEQLIGWLEWAGRLRKAVTGELSRADVRRLAGDTTGPDAALWGAATTLLATRQDVPMAPLKLGAATERSVNLEALSAGLRGREVADRCPEGADCPFDVYGRRFAAAIDTAGGDSSALIRHTLRMGRAVFQPELAAAVGA